MTFDQDMTFTFNLYEVLTLIKHMSKYQVSDIRESEVTPFSMIVGKLQENENNRSK